MKLIKMIYFLSFIILILFILNSLNMKFGLKKNHFSNIIILKNYYPIKEFTYHKMINEVKKQNIKRFNKKFISGASVKAIFQLTPLKTPRPTNNICQLTKEDFYWKLTINYHLPQWKSRLLAKKRLRKRWDKYLKKLIIHEDMHKDIFLRGASAIRSFINNIPSYHLGKNGKDCLDYLSKVKRKTVLIFKKFEEENLKFDFDSNFGQLNGLFF